MSWCGGGEIRPTPWRRVAQAGDVAVDLVARQLAALAGLGALGDLDLDLVGVDEVVDGHAEAPGGDLLDRRAALVLEALGVLSALARVRLAAEPVHAGGERLVRLRRQRTERHAARLEAPDDLRGGLDLVQRDALARSRKRSSPRSDGPRHRDLVHVGREALVGVGAALVPRGLLERRDRLRVPAVELAVAAPGVDAARRQQRGARGRVGAPMAVEALPGEHVQAHAADARRRPREVLVDDLPLEPDRLEDLRARVGADRRDPHLREDLEQALADRLDRPLHRLLGVHALRQAALAVERVERLEHQVRVDRRGAVADQAGHVMDLLGLARLHHQADLEPRALANEVVMDGADRQQRRHRRAVGAEVAIRTGR